MVLFYFNIDNEVRTSKHVGKQIIIKNISVVINIMANNSGTLLYSLLSTLKNLYRKYEKLGHIDEICINREYSK